MFSEHPKSGSEASIHEAFDLSEFRTASRSNVCKVHITFLWNMIIFTTYFTTFAFILTPIKRFLNWLFIGNYNTFLIAGQYNGGVVLSEILN